MHTTCPECSSVFRVTAEQLNAAHGQVRCGYCQTIFDALGSLEDDWKESTTIASENQSTVVAAHHSEPVIQTDAIEDDEQHAHAYDHTELGEMPDSQHTQAGHHEPAVGQLPDDEEPSALSELKSSELFNKSTISEAEFIKQENYDIKRQTEALFGKLAERITPKRAPVNEQEAVAKSQPPPVKPAADKVKIKHEKQEDIYALPAIEASPTAAPVISIDDDTPELLREELAAANAEPVPSYTPAWIAGIVFLSLTLTLQCLFYFKDDLAQSENYRGLIISLCNIFSCDVPLRNDAAHNKKSIVMLSHAITRINGEKNQLRIKAIFNNSASYPQSYPVLSIKMTNEQGQVTAMRRFQPYEYLAPHIDINSGLPAKTSVEIIIDIIKPSSPVFSYQFDFL